MASSDTPPTNEYIIDAESATETARLIEQDRLLTKALGGLFPEQPDLSSVERILDLACGPGKWAIDVAFAYPDKEVMGIDINHTMVNYARAMARSQQLTNVMFEAMDIKKLFELEDDAFDLVNVRSIIGLMDRESWPSLLTECKRILSPGGILRLTEGEIVVTNSPALQRFNHLLAHVMYTQGRTFSTDGNSLGVAYMLGTLLRHAGFQMIEKRPFILDASYGTELHYSSCKDTEIIFQLLKPYFLKSSLLTEGEFDQLYNEMIIETLGDDFTCTTFGLITWGKKLA